jgi:hypothetical protein
MTVSMTQKSAKKKSKKSAKAGANPSVLGSLRSTRPTRLGGDRRAGATASRATAAKPKATRSPAAKAKKTKTKAATKSPAAATQPKATAAHRPTPPPPPPRPANGRPSGTEIVTTAVQAVGELAQIGATVGTQLLKRAAQRLPRP